MYISSKIGYNYSRINEGKRKMGFLNNLFGHGEKPTQPEGEAQKNNPADELAAIREQNQASATDKQQDRLDNLKSGASEAGVANPADRYGQGLDGGQASTSSSSPEQVSSASTEQSSEGATSTTSEQSTAGPEEATPEDQKAA